MILSRADGLALSGPASTQPLHRYECRPGLQPVLAARELARASRLLLDGDLRGGVASAPGRGGAVAVAARAGQLEGVVDDAEPGTGGDLGDLECRHVRGAAAHEVGHDHTSLNR